MLPALLVCIVAHKSIFGVTFTMPREGQPLQALSFDLLLLVVFDTQCYEDALCPFLSAHCRTFVLQLQCLVKGTVLSEEGFFSSLCGLCHSYGYAFCPLTLLIGLGKLLHIFNSHPAHRLLAKGTYATLGHCAFAPGGSRSL
jgi:hypothetical protein